MLDHDDDDDGPLTDEQRRQVMALVRALPPHTLRALLEMHEKYTIGRAIVIVLVTLGSVALGASVLLNNGIAFLHQLAQPK